MHVSSIRVSLGLWRRDGWGVLLAQRAQAAHCGGLWELPGGKCNPGEAPFAALQREWREELGLCVHAGTLLAVHDHAYDDCKLKLYVFRITQLEGEPLGREGQLLRWVPVGQLKSLPMPEANAGFLDALLSVC